VLIANSNLVPHWATWEHFNELDAKGLAMYGQMTAASPLASSSLKCSQVAQCGTRLELAISTRGEFS
jgi:hypothetical protein